MDVMNTVIGGLVVAFALAGVVGWAIFSVAKDGDRHGTKNLSEKE